MLDISYVGCAVYLYIVDREETHGETRMRQREGAAIAVDAFALLQTVAAMVGEAHNERIRAKDGSHDQNFYASYKSPFEKK